MPNQRLELEIVFDETGAVTGVKKVNKAVGKSTTELKKASKKQTGFIKGMGTAWKFLAASVIIGTVIRAFKAVATKAIDAQETVSKFKTVFKDVGKEAEEMARDLADNFGLSRVAAKQLLGDTGDLLTGFGFTGKAALDLSGEVNKLAVDLASFTNFSGGAEGASKALTKALLGERESVKSLGISILEEDVKKQLAINSAKGLTFESERQAKAFATLQIAQQQSKNAMGDFARTSGFAANQIRILKSRFSDIIVDIGSKFVPGITKAIVALNDLIVGTSDADKAIRNYKKSIDEYREAQEKVSTLEKQNKKGTLEYTIAVNNLAVATHEREVALNALNEEEQKLRDHIKVAPAEIEKLEKAQDKLNKKLELQTRLLNGNATFWEKVADKAKQGLKQQIDNTTIVVSKQTEIKEIQDKLIKNQEKINELKVLENKLVIISTEKEKSLAETKLLNSNIIKERRILDIEEMKELEKLTKEEQFLDEEEKLENKINKLNDFITAFKEGSVEHTAIIDALAEYEIQKAEEVKQKKINAINEVLDISRQAAGFTNEIITGIGDIQKNIIDKNVKDEKEAAKKKAEVDRKLFNLKKAGALFSIVIDTAKAIMGALTIPGPVGIAMSIAAGINGAIQAGVVASKAPPPIPAFALGGTLGGKSGRDKNTFAGSRGETILNTAQGQNLFNSLESSGLLSGNGRGDINNSNDNRNQSRQYSIGTVVNQGGNEFDQAVDRRLSEGGDFN